MMSSVPQKITSAVFICENQRFWVGGGFGKRGLLPTERGPFSTEDGSISWKTSEEAAESEALLGLGWVWEVDGSFEVDTSGGGAGGGEAGGEERGASGVEDAAEAEEGKGGGDATAAEDSKDDGKDDGDGWLYSVDFTPNALRSASPKRGAVHFVRRRRLVRRRTIDPLRLLLPHGGDRHVTTCDHCDTDAVRFLSDKLLYALSVATLMGQNFQRTSKENKGTPDPMKDGTVLPLKAKLIQSLNLGSPPPEFAKGADGVNVNGDAKVRLEALGFELDKFGREKGNNLLSRASHVFNQTFDEDVVRCLDERKVEVSARYFGREERDAIAALAVKHLDPEYRLHCDRENCGDRCDFRPQPCSNEGCPEQISRKHAEEHDAVCRYKVIECPRHCGDEVPRNRLDVHTKDACPLRDAKCPLSTLGCTAVVLAKDVPQHLTDNSNAHILLAADRMMEYQGVIKRMHGRIGELERENAELRRVVAENKASAEAEVHRVEKKVNKTSKQLGTLESRCRSEFRAHTK